MASDVSTMFYQVSWGTRQITTQQMCSERSTYHFKTHLHDSMFISVGKDVI